jgi:hypothetical protein
LATGSAFSAYQRSSTSSWKLIKDNRSRNFVSADYATFTRRRH